MDGDLIKYLIWALVVGPIVALMGVAFIRSSDSMANSNRGYYQKIVGWDLGSQDFHQLSFIVAGVVLIMIGIGISFANVALAIGTTGLVLF